jgi:hypothetical protein
MKCPPLLNPDLSNAEAQMMDAKWWNTLWKPQCVHSMLDLDGIRFPTLPDSEKLCKMFFLNLARDMPVAPEFIPSVQLLRKFIVRATQITESTIRTMLNPPKQNQ